MNLQHVWQQYGDDKHFNYADIDLQIAGKGQTMFYNSGEKIVERGEFPAYIYFIIEGVAIGQRLYEDGNEYRYFQVDKEDGNIGLLEILGRKETYVATITCLTAIKAVRVESELVYQLIMTDLDLTRKCAYLLADNLYKRSGNDGIYYYYAGVDRVRLFLINYYDEHKYQYEHGNVIVNMNYEEIGNQIGVNVRTIGRSIKILKEAAEVTVKQRRIVFDLAQYNKMKTSLTN